MTAPSIAIVGWACRYPDANSPAELWQNVLAQRRAFRRMPPERLRLADHSPRGDELADGLRPIQVALLRDYEFDRSRHGIPLTTYEAVDLAHWLALDVAAEALADAGLATNAKSFPRERTGVIVGNSLPPEESRAHAMRQRWPHVRDVLAAELSASGIPEDDARGIIERTEKRYKALRAEPADETPGGGPASTIAGRICNHHDLHGGGYTVDGACASSLLAVITACERLEAGDLDIAIAGAVDLSLDPLDRVGFDRGLASERMRVFDAQGDGFWPGEGCGFVVLMRANDATRDGRNVRAVIRGWGVSSEGGGGLTPPTREGQLLAQRRAYDRACLAPDEVAYFEAHGTGTAIGDPIEVEALAELRSGDATAAAVGSVKANIGHARAAGGIAGLLKAAQVVGHGFIPPATGVEQPHDVFARTTGRIYLPLTGEDWCGGRFMRAGVSAFGFGGVNTHVIVEGEPATSRREPPIAPELLAPPQDCEVFLLGGHDRAELLKRVMALAGSAATLSEAELVDLACTLIDDLAGADAPAARAAVVAASPEELETRLRRIAQQLEAGDDQLLDIDDETFIAVERTSPPHIGFLFPGPAAPRPIDGGVWPQRFDAVSGLYTAFGGDGAQEDGDTRDAQPAIALASIAGVAALGELGIAADRAVGHGLGEIVALAWAGALDSQGLMQLTRTYGSLMAASTRSDGAMACVLASRDDVAALVAGEPELTIACSNAPREHVISGAAVAVTAAVERAHGRGLATRPLTASHALHSPLVADVVEPLRSALSTTPFAQLERRIISTVSAGELARDTDLVDLLSRQVLSPVRFQEAITAAGDDVDLWIEVGPGQGLRRLAGATSPAPIVSIDAGGESLGGLSRAVGAAFVLGAPLHAAVLSTGRFWRRLDTDRPAQFISDPRSAVEPSPTAGGAPHDAPLEALRDRVAARLELEVGDITPDLRLLSDLHLSSISVAQVVGEAARSLGTRRPTHATELADATVAEAAQALADAARGSPAARSKTVTGVEPWVRAFEMKAVRLRGRVPGAGPIPQSALVVRFPAEPTPADARGLLERARDALKLPAGGVLAIVQENGGAAGFARSLSLERPDLRICVLTATAQADEILREEIARTPAGYREVHVAADGTRCSPVIAAIPGSRWVSGHDLPLGADDVLLASGGARGIGAECALRLGRRTGAALAVLGRSPMDDPAVVAQLERLERTGVRARYYQADVRDAQAVKTAVARCAQELGAVTALLHAAGVNEPRVIAALDSDLLDETLAVKVAGLSNLLAAVDVEHLRMLVTFGSIIHRTGMQGAAHQALASEWQTMATESFARAHPRCRCLALEWSVWGGLGMGMSPGSLEALEQRGITPVSIDRGLGWLEQLLSQPPGDLPVAVVVSGRFGAPPTLDLNAPELSRARFVEMPRVHYPGIELVCDSRLSHERDPYLDDHALHGEAMLPGVMALEAMAQVGSALVGGGMRISGLRELRFAHPIPVPEGVAVTLRVACLLEDNGDVRAVVRSSTTDFTVDHVLGTLELAAPRIVGDVATATLARWDETRPDLALDPGRHLYDRLLFQQGRFQRVSSYHRLEAQGCEARIAAARVANAACWFDRHLSSELALGDPGARDALLHALQPCVPHRRVLPVAAERIQLGDLEPGGAYRVEADEILCEGDRYVFDVIMLDGAGHIVEKWLGLALQAIEPMSNRQPWPVDLIAPYLERRVQELMPDTSVRCALTAGDGARDEARQRTVRALFGRQVEVHHRGDGKPEVAGGEVSFSHSPPLCLAAYAPHGIACDLQGAHVRTEEEWHDLLDDDAMTLTQQLARRSGDDLELAATRVWGAREALRKLGDPTDPTPTLSELQDDSWIVLSGGHCTLLSWVAQLEGRDEPLVFTLLLAPRESHPHTALPAPPPPR